MGEHKTSVVGSQTVPSSFGGIVFLVIAAGFGALIALPRIHQSPSLLFAFTLVIVLASTGLIWQRVRAGRALQCQFMIRKPHVIQTLVQSGVFMYWGSAWTPVYEQAPLILAQICVAYLCEALISWRRFGMWRLGLGPFPVVLSTNLFLWFIDDYFIYQFAMIALAYWSRDVLCTVRDGRRAHIFNPSAFALGVAAIAILVLQVPDLTHGQMIAQTLGSPEYPYVWIFLMGFIVQAFFKVTFVTMSAAITMVLLGYMYTAVFGTYYYVDTSIPIAVFLGMNLLVTDPATSPNSIIGRCVFGILYGALVFVSYDILRDVDLVSVISGQRIEIAWLDKLLCVPLLNMLAQPIERLVGSWDRHMLEGSWLRNNAVHLGLWLIAFGAMYPQLTQHRGDSLAFWETSCEQGLRRACADRAKMYSKLCSEKVPQVCFNQGRAFEAGVGVSMSSSAAKASYVRACSGGLLSGCSEAVRLCESKTIACAQADLESLYEQGCVSGSVSACTTFAQRTVRGVFKHTSIGDMVRSFGVGCAQGIQSACAGIFAASVSKLPDFDFARLGFKTACDGGYADGCVNLALMNIRGDGGTKDLNLASRLLKKACALGHEKACTLDRNLQPTGGQ